MDYAKGENRLKIVTTVGGPALQKLSVRSVTLRTIHDIGIRAYGPLEDKVYLTTPKI